MTSTASPIVRHRLAAGLVAVLALMAGYVAVYLQWLGSPRDADGASGLVADGAILPLDALVVVLWVFAALRSSGGTSTRRAWLALSAAAAAMALGDFVYFWLNAVVGEDPFPSVGDAGYLAFYALMFVGLLRFPTLPRTRGETLRLLLDAAVIVVAGGMFVWELVLSATIQELDPDLLVSALTLGYPVGDLLLVLGIAVTVLRTHQHRNNRALALITAGALLFFAADIGFAIAEAGDGYLSGSWPDALYMLATAAFACAGVAAIYDANRKGSAEARRLGGVSPFPYVAVGAANVLVITVAWTSGLHLTYLIIGSALLTALVVIRQIVAVRDNLVLNRLQAEREVEERFRGLIQHAADVIMIVDKGGIVKYLTPSVRHLLGREPESLLGLAFVDIVHPADAAIAAALVAPRAHPGDAGDPSDRVELRLRDVAGAWCTTETIAADLRHVPAIGGVVLTTRDATERKMLEARLRDQALQDPLTGLANRRLFHDRVEHALRRAARQRSSTAVLFIDLDEFKRVNDTRGHEVGDALLVALASRIAMAVRGADTAARLGGDEFAVLIEDVVDPEDLIRMATRLCETIGAPVEHDARLPPVSASIGVAFARPGQEDVAELMRNADMAMYAAKAAGRNRVVRYDSSMHAMLVEDVALETDLRSAIAEGMIEVHYQPIFETATRRLVAAEALARWEHPTRGAIPPSTFIPIAESCGMIAAIGRTVLRDACREAATWPDADDGEALGIHVNLSAVQLGDASIVEDVLAALATSGLQAARLTLEITESVLARDTTSILGVLSALRDVGVRLSIDDFGTGYSSLSYLHTFPVQEIKVDRSFIRRLTVDSTEHQVFVRAMIEMAKGLDLDLIAEGIERTEQLEVLLGMGCRFGQGFLVAPALERMSFRRFVADGTIEPLAVAS